MNVLAISLTERGAALADRLPYEHHRGALAATIADRWDEVDGFVLFCATGIAVRVIGPRLVDKHTDPAVVCVDEAGRHVVALCGGHSGGANDLAREVAAALGAEPVITTATDVMAMPALDQLAGFEVSGDVAGVTRAMLDGRSAKIENPLDWPLALDSGEGPERIVVTDQVVDPEPGVVVLHPPSLVLGVGASSDAPPEKVEALVREVLATHNLARASVGVVATIDRRASDAGLTGLGHPIRSFTSEELATQDVPTPSEYVAKTVGTPSVAEAAALLVGDELLVTKSANDVATVAVARRAPVGHLFVVGLGPGDTEHRTPAATTAVRRASHVIGYGPYVDQCSDVLRADQRVIRSPIGAEVDRCAEALRLGAAGHRVALVCSGDAGVFAMAALVGELAGGSDAAITVVPGVTAALASTAVLGAPLGHDHAMISLSDLLTPWEMIERRVEAVARADMAVAFYNPRSEKRDWQLPRALEILAEHRPATTPVGIVTDVGRPTESVVTTELALVDPTMVTMVSCVIVGSSTTALRGGRVVTPRGYAVGEASVARPAVGDNNRAER